MSDTLFDMPDDRKAWQRSKLETPDVDQDGKQHRHPQDTESKAAKDIRLRSGTARARVLLALKRMPQTDDEMQESIPMNPNTERPRRVELLEGGYIEDSGHRRITRYGSEAIVWRVTEAGRAWR